MVQVLTCVSVHCGQCGEALGDPARPGTPAHHPGEEGAYAAARAAGWVIDPGGRWWCSCCGPVLTCEAQGHQFTEWRPGTPTEGRASGAYRYCRRCCLHETTRAPSPGRPAGEEVGWVITPAGLDALAAASPAASGLAGRGKGGGWGG